MKLKIAKKNETYRVLKQWENTVRSDKPLIDSPEDNKDILDRHILNTVISINNNEDQSLFVLHVYNYAIELTFKLKPTLSLTPYYIYVMIIHNVRLITKDDEDAINEIVNSPFMEMDSVIDMMLWLSQYKTQRILKRRDF